MAGFPRIAEAVICWCLTRPGAISSLGGYGIALIEGLVIRQEGIALLQVSGWILGEAT